MRSAGKAAFDTLVEEAMPAGDYLVERLSAGLDLGSLDGRALLGDAAGPLLARIPPGVHRQVLIERIARQIGVSPATFDAPLERPVEPVYVRSSPDAASRESPIARRLLGYLVRAPALFRALPASLASALFDASDEDGGSLFQRVARHVADDPDVEPTVLLARFTRDPEHEALVALARAGSMLDDTAVADEFVEGVQRYVIARSRSARQKLLNALREDGSSEGLSRYWQARQESMQFENVARGPARSIAKS